MSVKIEIHPGDVLASGAPIIAHQVNCKGVMGAGVAKAIKKKYRSVYNDYRKLCVEKGAALMGETQFVWTADRTVVANCFAQNEFGIGSRQTTMRFGRVCPNSAISPKRRASGVSPCPTKSAVGWPAATGISSKKLLLKSF